MADHIRIMVYQEFVLNTDCKRKEKKKGLCWEWQSSICCVERIHGVSVMDIGNLLSAVVLLCPLAIEGNDSISLTAEPTTRYKPPPTPFLPTLFIEIHLFTGVLISP
jgi:hypothetical protein